MAIQPEIALGIKTPEVEGPMEGFKNTIALKNMLDSAAMNRQLMQMREQELQTKKLEQQDIVRAQKFRQTYSDAMQANTHEDKDGNIKIDTNGVAKYFTDHGFGDKAEDYLKTADAHNKELEETMSKHRDNIHKELTPVSGLLAGVDEVKDEELPAWLGQKRQAIMGLNLSPGAQSQMSSLQFAPDAGPADIRRGINTFRDMITTEEEKKAARTEKREADTAAQQKLKSQADIKKTTQETAEAVKDLDARDIASMGSSDQFMQRKADDLDFAKRHPGNWKEELDWAKKFVATKRNIPATNLEINDFVSKADPTDGQVHIKVGDEMKTYTADPTGHRQYLSDVAGERVVQEKKDLAAQGGPFAGVAPSQQSAAIAENSKSRKVFNDATTAANNVLALIKAAREGNRFGGAYAATAQAMAVNVAEEIKRVNMAEIATAANAGNAWDRVKGYFGKLVEGQPLDEKILSDMESVTKLIQKNSIKRRNADIKGINEDYAGAKVPLLDEESGQSAGAPSSGGGKRTVVIGGRTFKEGDSVPVKGGAKVIDHITEEGNVVWK